VARRDVGCTRSDIRGRAGAIDAHLRSLAESCPGRNDWFCGPALEAARPDLVAALVEHVLLAALALAGAAVVALPVTLLARRLGPLRALGRGVAGVVTALPLLALVAGTLALLVRTRPDLPSWTAVVLPVGLVCTVLLVQSLAAGLAAVPAAVVEAARAAGYDPTALLVRVELRTALPRVLGGVRTATAAAVSLSTAGAAVGRGGLGDVLVQGVRDGARTEVLAAAVLVVALALLPDLLLLALQRRLGSRSLVAA